MKHRRIDIAITATLRPEILARTLSSAREYLFGDWPIRAVINVDPIGEIGVTQGEVVEVARAICDEVLCRTPRSCRYADAWRWTWANTESDFVYFPLDDNMLLRKIDLEDVLECFHEYHNLALLRFPEWPTEADHAPQWKHPFKWNGRYFECPEDKKGKLGVAGKASIIRGWFCHLGARHMDISVNPEKQFRSGSYNDRLLRMVKFWSYGVYGKPNELAAFKDIGLKWRREHKYGKDREFFMTTWERYE